MASEKSLTMFKRADRLSLYRALCIQFTLSSPISVRSILILFFPLYLGLTHCLFPSGFPPKFYMLFSTVTYMVGKVILMHAMKAYRGIGGITALIVSLSTRWQWVVSFTPHPLYPWGKSPWYPLNRSLDEPQSQSWWFVLLHHRLFFIRGWSKCVLSHLAPLCSFTP